MKPIKSLMAIAVLTFCVASCNTSNTDRTDIDSSSLSIDPSMGGSGRDSGLHGNSVTGTGTDTGINKADYPGTSTATGATDSSGTGRSAGSDRSDSTQQ
jgi:hypothetical protein